MGRRRSPLEATLDQATCPSLGQHGEHLRLVHRLGPWHADDTSTIMAFSGWPSAVAIDSECARARLKRRQAALVGSEPRTSCRCRSRAPCVSLPSMSPREGRVAAGGTLRNAAWNRSGRVLGSFRVRWKRRGLPLRLPCIECAHSCEEAGARCVREVGEVGRIQKRLSRRSRYSSSIGGRVVSPRRRRSSSRISRAR